MAEIMRDTAFGRRPILLPTVILVIGIAGTTLATLNLGRILPPGAWLAAILSPHEGAAGELLFTWSALPRLAISFLCGAGLSLAGVVFQQCLRNPLAEPTTLGTSAGAQAALLIALVWFPGLLDVGYGPVAIAGAALATLLVFTVANGTRRSALSIVLSGLVVNLTLGTISAIIVLLHPKQAEDLAQWQAGRLEQSNWGPAAALVPCLFGMAGALAFLVRPLALLDLGDKVVLSLGLRPALLRTVFLGIAVVLAGSIVAAVGTIGFIGLAVPALARALGARSLPARLLWSPLLGGLLLVLADQIVQLPAIADGQLPTGLFASLLGAPVLLFLMTRLQPGAPVARQGPPPIAAFPVKRWHPAAAVVLALIAVAASLSLGRGPLGWEWTLDTELIMRWRAARAAAAIGAGILLGIAGVLVQRLTANPMASPEVMGISAGATLGAILLVLCLPMSTPGDLLVASTGGALATSAAVALFGWRAKFSPEALILTGVAVSTIVGALAALLIATGGPARGLLLTWMSGSTYRATGGQALLVAILAVIALLAAVPFHRQLDLLGLGDAAARSLGVAMGSTKASILLLCALATAGATIVVGPASFVGLLAPHLVRQLGFARALPQLCAAALTGGMLMLAADWLGRTLIFPWQMPAGLLTALIGGPFFLLSLHRRS